MDTGKHARVNMKTELKDYIRLNKSESFINFIIKHTLSFLKAQGFLHMQEWISYPEDLLLSEGCTKDITKLYQKKKNVEIL